MFYGETHDSRLILGTARYPSPAILAASVQEAGCQLVTVSLRRETAGSGDGSRFFTLLRELGVKVLPNTAGCHTVAEAVTTAHMAREVFGTDWIKLEVIADDDTLQPHPLRTLEAAKELIGAGFKVFPYITEDLAICRELFNSGCQVLMPWGAPIGTGKGLVNPYGLKVLRERLPEATLIVDAGIGRPSDACLAMEWGYDAVLLNTAVAASHDPVTMAKGFAAAVRAGRMAYEAGIMPPRERAHASTPVLGLADLGPL